MGSTAAGTPGVTQPTRRHSKAVQGRAAAAGQAWGLEEVAEKKKLKLVVWELFDNPQSSSAAFVIALVLLVLTMVSCLAFCLQTISFFYAGDQTVWEVIEAICIIVFTIEYICRFFSAPDRGSFVREPLSVIDVIAILPFYVEMLMAAFSKGSDVAGLGVFRIVRLARVFRLFKLGRYSDGLKTFATTMSQSTRPLAMLLFFMVIAIVLFSSAIYYAERGTWDEVRRIWWRDGNLGRLQSIDEQDNRLVFYTACKGHSHISVDSDNITSVFDVMFVTEKPFVGSGVAVRTVETIHFWANDTGAALTFASPADSTNASAWVEAQAWSAMLADGRSPWPHASCHTRFELDERQISCFDDRATWPTAGEDAVVKGVKTAALVRVSTTQDNASSSHTLEVSVSGLTCKEVGCLYCSYPSPFESIPASFYWSAVTMTTVGYGDVYPVTWAGQLIACFTMMTGILILALPITVIGTYFAAEYEEYLRRQKIDADYKQRMQKVQQAQGEAAALSQTSEQQPAAPGTAGKESSSAEAKNKGEEDIGWLQNHEPVNVYDEMDWIAHRSRAELRSTLESIIRQERDNLVLKLNSVVQRYTRQTA